jgi:bifunctional polynucleotide phosphatase/kinase
VVIVTDQSKPWKITQIQNVMKTLDLEHLTVVIGVKTQKPKTDLFNKALPKFKPDNAFYVGDAAGRPGDWSDKDKVFATNINVKFYTPEEIFELAKDTTATNAIKPASKKEVVIMVGYPASGKSTIAKTTFGTYHIVNGDLLKTPAAMIKDAEKHVETQSIVFDSTAGTKEKRALYIKFAEKYDLPVRVLWVTTPIDVTMERNKTRAQEGGPKIPDIAFYVYRKHFQIPEESEGFKLLIL